MRGVPVKPTAITTIIISFLLICFCTSETLAENKTYTSKKEKISYIIGTNMAKSLLQIKDEIEINALVKGLNDQFAGKPAAIPEKEATEIMREFSAKMTELQKEKKKEIGEKASKEGKKFLEENKKKKDVVTTKSGLQYTVVKKGDGKMPAATDKVKVHYRGTTLDGAEFDSSFQRGAPATFPVSGVIKGWTEALQLMKVGSKYKLFIPSDLAYGDRGAGPRIGPNQVLIFDVELISIEK
jgi:FKBP-type peptidyl-prolyl cis-trans isomerase